MLVTMKRIGVPIAGIQVVIICASPPLSKVAALNISIVNLTLSR